jgi:hypothetical protein
MPIINCSFRRCPYEIKDRWLSSDSFHMLRFSLGPVGALRLAAIILFTLMVVRSPTVYGALPQQAEQVQKVTVYPSSVTYGDPLDITITGFPSSMFLSPGTVSFHGKQVPIPGSSGMDGARLKSDDRGVISFTTTLPNDVDVGTFPLTVEVPSFFNESVDLTFRGATLTLSTSVAVPNQTISLIGTGFTSGLQRHKTGGAVSNSLELDGKILRPPYVDYPIELDDEGNFFTTITIPADHATSSGTDLTLEVTDSGGRKGVTAISIATPRVYVTPDIAYPGQEVELVGQGFVATNSSLGIYNKIDVAYWTGVKTVAGKTNEASAITLLAQAGYPDGFTGPYSGVDNQDSRMLEALVLLGVSPDDDAAIETSQGTNITVDGDATFVAYFVPQSVGDALVSELGDFRLNFVIPLTSKVPSYNEFHLKQTRGQDIKAGHLIPESSMVIIPAEVYPGEELKIQLAGLERDYYLTSGALDIEGIRLELPGHLGLRGEKPKTDSVGSVTVIVEMPKLPPGAHLVTFAWGAESTMTTTVIIPDGVLQTVPAHVTPGQTIFVRAQGLSPSSDNRPWPAGSHEISGLGDSIIKINGTAIDPNYVAYPVTIGRDGQAFFPVTVPVNSDLVSSIGVPISVIDSVGRTSSGSFIINKPRLTISPDTGLKGSYISVNGSDFVANNAAIGHRYQIDIAYAGSEIKTIYPDSFGNFETMVKVPVDVQSGKSYGVTAKLRQLPMQAEAIHSIPPAELIVTPAVIEPGISIVIAGSGFPNNDPIKSVWIGGVSVARPSVATDSTGYFTISVRVPENTRLGRNSVSVDTTYFALATTVEVVAD